MRMPRALPLAAALLSVIAVAACGSGGSGSSPATTGPPSISADPIDLSPFVGKPCTMLRADQLAQYRLSPPGTTVSSGSGPACRWTPTLSTLPGYTARADLRSGGLTALYARRASMPVFQPTPVSLFPAVNTASSAAAIKHGQCTAEVGVAQNSVLVVDVTVPDATSLDYADPCSDADAVAAAIIADAEGQVP
ncbi:MAG TPA: DUF3558 family protein [Pseudonocardiaceae bacterium]|jgi:hypothetical protein|nr:DUF3558 family protein [Pseudonocardiaceae bacterium]